MIKLDEDEIIQITPLSQANFFPKFEILLSCEIKESFPKKDTRESIGIPTKFITGRYPAFKWMISYAVQHTTYRNGSKHNVIGSKETKRLDSFEIFFLHFVNNK